jgi:release factor glutamine methyltransferase
VPATSELGLRETLQVVTERLEAAGCESPRVDADLLLAHVLGTTRSGLSADLERRLTGAERRELDRLVVRREAREPLAYVLGEWGFRRLVLRVDARVLVPRPETEVVADRCLALMRGRERPRVLDVGTGSGAIALALADELEGATVVGIDVSEGALALAHENVERCAVDVELRRHDLFDGLPDGPWDLVVSNPPYVDAADLDTLDLEVRNWEPRIALVGDGATEAVARGASSVLAEGGALVLEVADGDAARVAKLIGALGFRDVSITRDLAGRERVVEGIA